MDYRSVGSGERGVMAVYTDGTHLIADSPEELHRFAAAMGLKREWFQEHPRHSHYDLTTARAAERARANGAYRISTRELVLTAQGKLVPFE